jgi:hypothetical protein
LRRFSFVNGTDPDGGKWIPLEGGGSTPADVGQGLSGNYTPEAGTAVRQTFLAMGAYGLGMPAVS